MKDDPYGLQIATWLRTHRPELAEELDVDALIFSVRQLERSETLVAQHLAGNSGWLSSSFKAAIDAGVHRLSLMLTTISSFAAQSESSTAQTSAESEVAGRIVRDMAATMDQVCEKTKDALLLDVPESDSDSNLENTTVNAVAEIVGAKAALDLRQ